MRLPGQTPGGLAEVFFGHRGRVIHKWVHYLEIYERHFAPYRNSGEDAGDRRLQGRVA
jgi:hypothetical protein